MVTTRGAMRMPSIVRPSNLAICSRTNASPRVRTPSIISSATRNALSITTPLPERCRARLRRAELRGFGRAQLDPTLHPRNQFADPFSSRSVRGFAYDQPRRDLRDQVLDLEVVHAHRLARLDEID